MPDTFVPLPSHIVTVLGITFDISIQANQDTVDALHSAYNKAVGLLKTALDDDQARSANYSAVSTPYYARAATANYIGVSLLQDCGIPVVKLFSDFVDAFTANDLSITSLPFCGVSPDTVSTIWDPDGLHPKAWWRQRWHEHIVSLSRLDNSDAVWKAPRQQRWWQAFAPKLIGYMTDLFSGRFLDRNGTKIDFDLSKDIATLLKRDIGQVAPQVTGNIVTALMEFLGDQLFEVPFYSADILSTFRQRQAVADKAQQVATYLDGLKTDLLGGTLSPATIAHLKIPQEAQAISWQVVPQSSWIEEKSTRVLLRIADSTDIAWLAALQKRDMLADTLLAVEAGTHDLNQSFTCEKAGVIDAFLKCIFIPQPHPGVCYTSGNASAFGNTGALTEPIDYADLVGKLVSFAATSAQKCVRSLSGGIVRGVSLLSLDNEVLAEAIGAAAAGLAKKIVEKVMYETLCNYIDDATIDLNQKKEFLKQLAAIQNIVVEP